MRTLLIGARVITPDDDIPEGHVLIEDGRIAAVGTEPIAADGTDVMDLGGLTLVPGFVDVHVHGGGGFSLCTRDPLEIASYAQWAVRYGVTSFLATVCATDIDEGVDFVRAAAAAEAVGTGANLLGINLEGPFVNPERRGALPNSWATKADEAALDRLLEAAAGKLRLITIAPELAGAGDLIHRALAAGVCVSIGHSDATFEVASAAFATGASHVTHAFNAMRPWHHREPGPLGAALKAPGVTVELIADGVHLHPATVDLIVRSFGQKRVALVTDAVTPAGLDSGSFQLGGQKARLEDGRITLPDRTIAGSVATMDGALRNVFAWNAAALADAIRMASTVPASVLRCGHRKGRIAPGYDADLVALNRDLTVKRTFVAGALVHQT